MDGHYISVAAKVAAMQQQLLQLVPPESRTEALEIIEQRDRCVTSLFRIKRALLSEGIQHGNA